MKRYYHIFRKDVKRFGLQTAILGSLYNLTKRIGILEILYIIMNDRRNIRKPKLKFNEKMLFKIATRQDLLTLKDQGEYQIDEEKLDLFDRGELCLLNYSNDEVAGYTHAHVSGRPILKPHLELEIPDNMIYNFAGFTLPKFRGRNHHGMRHYELMQLPQCLNKRYMIGYVEFDNFAALRGDRKSGYAKIGYILVLGIARWKFIYLSKDLRKHEIRLRGDS